MRIYPFAYRFAARAHGFGCSFRHAEQNAYVPHVSFPSLMLSNHLTSSNFACCNLKLILFTPYDMRSNASLCRSILSFHHYNLFRQIFQEFLLFFCLKIKNRDQAAAEKHLFRFFQLFALQRFHRCKAFLTVSLSFVSIRYRQAFSHLFLNSASRFNPLNADITVKTHITLYANKEKYASFF